MVVGGERGIRTPGTLASTPHFECGAFNHSATSPATQYQELSNKHYKNIWCSGPNFGPKLSEGFWVKLDIPKRRGGNKKRLACPLLNFTQNRIMQTARYIRLLALLTLGNVFPSEAIGRIV